MLFGFGTGTKRERLNFCSAPILNLPLVSALNSNNIAFPHLVQAFENVSRMYFS
jgi:hypothetical protein